MIPRLWVLLALVIALLAVLTPLVPTSSMRSSPELSHNRAGDPSYASGAVGASGTWSTFLGAASRDSYSPSPGLLTIRTSWVSCFTNQSIRIGPVIVGNEVIVSDNLGHVFALNNSENGELLWGQNLATIVTELDVAGATLLIGDSSGNLYALSATTGAQEWKQALGGGIVQAPLDLNGTAYVGTSAGDVVALNVSTGAITWTERLGTGIGGALAENDGTIYAVTTAGTIEAMSLTGSPVWSVSTGASVVTAVSVGDGMVVVGTLARTVQAYAASNGSALWSFEVPSPNRTASEVRSTPALGDGLVVVQTPNGALWALNASDGVLAWSDYFPEYGGVNVAGPVVTPSAIYALDSGAGLLYGLGPTNGSILWSTGIGDGDTSNAFPAVDQGDVVLGTEEGCVAEYASSVPLFTWPVTGMVLNETGGPIPGAVVVVGTSSTTSEPNGSFEIGVSNGTWSIVVSAFGYVNVIRSINVHGPLSGLDFVLRVPEMYELAGEVRNGLSGAALRNVSIVLATAAGPLQVLVTGPDGTFSTVLPNGTYNLTIAPTSEYAGSSVIVLISGKGLTHLGFPLIPVASAYPGLDPSRLVIVLPIAATLVGSAGVYLHEFRRRRLAMGLTGRILSPFGRYVVMRGLLVPAQASLLIGLVYVFDYIIADPSGVNLFQAFTGFGVVWYDLFTGNWGVSSLFGVNAPTSTFFLWWLPPSIELAVASLALSALISYPLGLVAGGGRSGVVDGTIRIASAVALMIPTFLVGLVLIFAFNPAFVAAFGDGPFGLLPSPAWFSLHANGFPTWVGPAGNTSPTDIPILDPVIHGAWTVEAIAWAKLGLQALVIAIVFSAIFLRYARGAIVEAAREMYLTGARARGVSESTILWRHLARRALPYYFLAFGLSLPAYIGTQALVEFLFEDHALGTLILGGLTSPTLGVFGSVGVFQVAIFLVIVAVLIAVLVADVAARYFDPRLLRRES